MKNKRDKPMRERCDCGKKVKNHHMLCDDCAGKREKEKDKKKKEKLMKDYYKNIKK